MPIYEYQCQKCGTFETTQKITDKPLAKCPTCKGKVRKLISNTSFQLKGTGWYITDYARKGKDGDGKSESTKSEDAKSGSASKPAAETKTESKKSDGSSKSAGDKTPAASSTAST
jgi:putative FmdB family regulatory protein